MSSTGGSSETSGLYFVAILLLIVIIRIRRVATGTKISKLRSAIYSVYYLGFAGLLIAGSFLTGVSPYYSVVYAAIGAAGLYGAHRVIDKRLVFWRGPDGSIYAKGGLGIYLVYVVALVVRVAIDLVYVPSALDFSFTATTLTGPAITAEIATDALLAFGSGLLTGRNIRLFRRYVNIERGKETIPDSPPS